MSDIGPDSYERAYGEFASHFRHGMPNPKLAGRRALLAAHPELRVRVDTEPLRRIIGYAAFKCVNGSSIARDEAIRGSDIDGGLVVLREPTSLDTEMMFIDELRRQGFNVYHSAEAAAANTDFEAAIARGMLSSDPARFDALNHAHNEKDLNRINFMTEDILRAASPFANPGKTYWYGYEI
jgi:hypothetical protein